METFQHVGPRVAFGDVAISNEEAELFRQTALQGTKVNKLAIDEESTHIQTSSFTSGLMSDAAADYDVYSMAFYTKSDLGNNPDFWRSVVSFARFNSKQSDTKIYNIYEIESYEGEVEKAVRRVRIIRNLSRIAFDENGDPFEDTYSHQRKAFETRMTSDDIETVALQMDRIMGRQRATGGR